MARKCLCDRLREQIRTDPALATLPMAAKFLWLVLAEAAAETGRLAVGSPFGFLAGIAMLTQCAEPEVEPNLQMLVDAGLIIRYDNAIQMIVRDTGTRRGFSNKINGKRGGRPRSGESSEEAMARRQATFMLPLPKPNANPPQHRPSRASDSDSDSIRSVSDQTRDDAPAKILTRPPLDSSAVQALANDLVDIAGLDRSRHIFTFKDVNAWLGQGIPESTIRSVVAEITERARAGGKVIGSLRYFERAMQDRHAQGAEDGQNLPLDARLELARAMKLIEDAPMELMGAFNPKKLDKTRKEMALALKVAAVRVKHGLSPVFFPSVEAYRTALAAYDGASMVPAPMQAESCAA